MHIFHGVRMDSQCCVLSSSCMISFYSNLIDSSLPTIYPKEEVFICNPKCTERRNYWRISKTKRKWKSKRNERSNNRTSNNNYNGSAEEWDQIAFTKIIECFFKAPIHQSQNVLSEVPQS